MSIARLAIDDAGAAAGELVAAGTRLPPAPARHRVMSMAPWALAAAFAAVLVVVGLPGASAPPADPGKVVQFPLPVPDGFLRIVGRPSSMALTGDGSIRRLEDAGNQAGQFALAKAVASGDARLMQQAGLSSEIARLERLQAAHLDEQVAVRREIAAARREITAHRARNPFGEAAN